MIEVEIIIRNSFNNLVTKTQPAPNKRSIQTHNELVKFGIPPLRIWKLYEHSPSLHANFSLPTLTRQYENAIVLAWIAMSEFHLAKFLAHYTKIEVNMDFSTVTFSDWSTITSIVRPL